MILVMCLKPEGRVQRGQSQALSSAAQCQEQRPRPRHVLKHRTFPLYVKKGFLTVRVPERWHRLPRQLVESPSLELLKKDLATVLGSWLWAALLEQQGWTRWTPEVPSSLHLSEIWWQLAGLPPCLLCTYQGCGPCEPGRQARVALSWAVPHGAPSPGCSSRGGGACSVASGRRCPHDSSFPSLCPQRC